jgi:hypothetical protein
MANKVRKTEHVGPKRGRGALWGTKYEAKSGSWKLRRRNAQMLIRQELDITSLSPEKSQ